jgi:type I restriction enzyme M protein
MSDGTLHALGLLVAAKQTRWEHQLLIVEEPESSIHPGAAALLCESLEGASKHGAILLTTHSPDLLDAARSASILVCDYRDGVTRIGPLAAAQQEIFGRSGAAIAWARIRTG